MQLSDLMIYIKVEPIGLVYGKHKVFGWLQCIKNQLTDKLFNFLYNPKNLCSNVYNNFSFIRQVSEAIGVAEINPRNVHTILSQALQVTMFVMIWT